VSAGLAENIGWPVALVRWLFVGTTFISGAGALFYLWLWALTPMRPADTAAGESPVVRRKVSVVWLLLEISILLALTVIVLAFAFNGGSALFVVTPMLVASTLGAVGWNHFIDIREDGRAEPRSQAIRVATGAGLLGISFLLLVASLRANVGWLVLLVILTALGGLAVLVGPRLLDYGREQIARRSARDRAEERAEIAAHLHDSVLQTLALIQNRAGASSEVARIARAQERELRDWLYAGASTVDSDLVTDLKDFASALEIDYPVRIEVIAVGEAIERASGEVASAAREAMLNAARHAGGEVSVYVESSVRSVDVFVRDRGPGFNLGDVEDGRFGVRESIIGRMKRAGGFAKIGRGAGGEGTEIQLHLAKNEEDSGE
jgi:signal transduction histidine kinase